MTDGHVRAESSAELAALTPAAPSLHNTTSRNRTPAYRRVRWEQGRVREAATNSKGNTDKVGEGTSPAC